MSISNTFSRLRKNLSSGAKELFKEAPKEKNLLQFTRKDIKTPKTRRVLLENQLTRAKINTQKARERLGLGFTLNDVVEKMGQPFRETAGLGITPQEVISEAPSAIERGGGEIAKAIDRMIETENIVNMGKGILVRTPTRFIFSALNLLLPKELNSIARDGVNIFRNFAGVHEDVETYKEETQRLISEGWSPSVAALYVGSTVFLDSVIVISLLNNVAKLITDNIKVPKEAQVGAWEALGKPNTIEEANQRFKVLAHLTHPDMPGGSNERFKALNSAWDIIKKEGIPKQPITPLRIFRRGAEELQKPISEVGIGRAEKPFLGISGILPQEVGTIPEPI